MQKKITYKQTEVYYQVVGNGIPVVLLHGFGEDSTIFQYQINFLRSYCQLIIPDLPGSGLSLFNKEYASIDDYALMLYQLLLKESINECIVLGHSMGGYIALAFAAYYPEKLKALGLLHSTAFADSPEKKEIRKRGIESIEKYGHTAFLKNTIPNLFFSAFKETNGIEIESLIEKGKRFSKEALQHYYTIMMNRTDRTKVLANNLIPILFVVGKEDTAVPLQLSLQQIHLPNCSYVHILQHVAHMGMLEEKNIFTNYILSFIEDVINIYT